MNVHELLQQLRQHLSQPPSREVWKVLEALLLQPLSEEDLQLCLDYVEGHLQAWPTEFRELECTFFQYKELSALFQHPLFPMTRSLRLEFRSSREVEPESREEIMTCVEAFFPSQHLQHIEHLTIRRWKVPSLVEPLRSCLASLKSLEWFECVIQETRDMNVLSDAPWLESLEKLHIVETALFDDELEPFLRHGNFPRLRSLRFHGCTYLNAGTLTAIAHNPTFAELRSFQFLFNGDSAINYEVLAQAPHLQKLELLECSSDDSLSFHDILEEWTKPSVFPELHTLLLMHCNLPVNSLMKLLSTEHMPALKRLQLLECELYGESGVTSVQESMLKTFELSGLLDPAVNWLVPLQTVEFRELRHLAIQHNQLSHREITDFLCTRVWNKLEYLNLEHNNLTSKGLQELADCSGFPSLKALDIADCKVRDPGAKALLDSPHFAALESVRLGGNKVSKKETQRFLDSARFHHSLAIQQQYRTLLDLSMWELENEPI